MTINLNDIKYICQIEVSTGRIIQALHPQASIVPEGLSEDGSIRTVYITEFNLVERDLALFLQHWWFDSRTMNFIEVGAPPNAYCTWDLVNRAWVWDSAPVLADIRNYRARFLQGTDWTQVSDNTLTDAQREEARAYRTALRNITNGLDNPENIEDVSWPTPPSFL